MSNTWDDLLMGEGAPELAAKIDAAMAGALEDGKRMEAECRAHPEGEKDGKIFGKVFDPQSQPPTPATVIQEALIEEYRSSLGPDWTGRIRINFRERGKTANVYATYSRNVAPMDDDDDDGTLADPEDYDFDDEGFTESRTERQPAVPHIPLQQHPGYQSQPDHPGNWRSPTSLPAVDMHGTGHLGASSYERRRLAAQQVGLNEPLSELLMAPQWAALVDMLGGHADRQTKANLDYAGIIQGMFGQVVQSNEMIIMRVLDNNAPGPVQNRQSQEESANTMLGVGMKLMKMMKQGGGGKNKGASQDEPAPAWGNPRGGGEAAGDWNRPALDLPRPASPSEFEDEDDFENDFEEPDPRPRRPRPGGSARVSHAPTQQLDSGPDIANAIRRLSKTDPDAAKAMVLDVKDDVANALGVDPDLLDAFLDDDD